MQRNLGKWCNTWPFPYKCYVAPRVPYLWLSLPSHSQKRPFSWFSRLVRRPLLPSVHNLFISSLSPQFILSWLGLVTSHLVIRIISTKLNISVSSVSQPVSPPPQMLMWFQDWEFFCKTIDSMIWCVIFIHFLLYYIYKVYICYNNFDMDNKLEWVLSLIHGTNHKRVAPCKMRTCRKKSR